jgi:hypothetical protein
MHALLSALFGAFLTLVVYGLSFIPTDTLSQGDDSDEFMEQTSQNLADNDRDAMT